MLSEKRNSIDRERERSEDAGCLPGRLAQELRNRPRLADHDHVGGLDARNAIPWDIGEGRHALLDLRRQGFVVGAQEVGARVVEVGRIRQLRIKGTIYK